MFLLFLACTLSPVADPEVGPGDSAEDSGDDATPGGETTPGPEGYSRASPSCSPVDAAGVELVLGLDAESCEGGVGPLSLSVWAAGPGPLPPGAYPVEQVVVEGEVVPWTGVLQVSDWGAVVLGSYRLEADDGTVVGGSFSAPWCESGTLCG